MSERHSAASRSGRLVFRMAVPIIVAWVAVATLLNTVVPQLEEVTKANSVSLSPKGSAAMQAMQHIGQKFGEFDSDSALMIVLEGTQPLGEDARNYYTRLVARLEQDRQHVEHVQDFWADRVTAAGSQSEDGKAAYV